MAEEENKQNEQFPRNDYTSIVPREQLAAQKRENRPKRQVQAKIKKQTFGDRIAENIKNIDHEQIRERLLFDWLFPEIVSTVADMLRMVFFGNKNGGTGRAGNKGRYTTYNSIYDGSRRDRSTADLSKQNFRHIRIPFESREDAEYVLDELRESLETSASDCVTVKELYSLANMPTNYSMTKWGWYDLEDANIMRQGEDHVLEMPKAEVLR